MPRILGHTPGPLELVEQFFFRAIGSPEHNSESRPGPGLLTHPESRRSARQHARSTAASATPLHTQAQLRAGEPKTRVATADLTRSQREATVIAALDKAGINDRDERAMFMAQMSHESNGFMRLTENLSYKPVRLLTIFPKKFESLADAQAVVGQGQAAIAERIYGNRRRLGNVHPGDGYRYRGRGIVQLTGRANYRQAGQAIGVDLEASPGRAEELDVAILAALWFWQSKGIAVPAQEGDVEKVTLLINGGTIGLADRKNEFAAWQRKLPIAPAGGGRLL